MVDLCGLSASEVPIELFGLHRSLRGSGASARLRLTGADWSDQRLDDVTHLCGLTWSRVNGAESAPVGDVEVDVEAVVTAPATIGPNMRLLIVGVNPSPKSAETMVPFGRNGNRFWPSVLRAGLARVDRDPEDLLRHGAVGMADLSKTVTRRADEVPPEELALGLARLERIVAWLRPAAVAVLGVTAWRVATGDRSVALGRQPSDVAGVPLWILPNPSGLNAHTSVEDMAERLAQVSESRTA